MNTFALDLDGKHLVRLACPKCWNAGFRAVLVLELDEATPAVQCPRCGTRPHAQNPKR